MNSDFSIYTISVAFLLHIFPFFNGAGSFAFEVSVHLFKS